MPGHRGGGSNTWVKRAAPEGGTPGEREGWCCCLDQDAAPTPLSAAGTVTEQVKYRTKVAGEQSSPLHCIL